MRRSASLILSLFHLMAGSTIPDVRSDPEKAMLKLQARARAGIGLGLGLGASPRWHAATHKRGERGAEREWHCQQCGGALDYL
jgi:hypothetical protein